MNSEYPPLPRPRAVEDSIRTLSLQNTVTPVTSLPSSGSEESLSAAVGGSNHDREHRTPFQPVTRAISSKGDVIIEYTDRDSDSSKSRPASYHWQVASDDLVQNSPYFRALLDPSKFAEGRNLMKQRALLGLEPESTNQTSDERAGSLDHEEQKPEGEKDVPRDLLLPTISLPVDWFKRKVGAELIELFLKILSLNSFDDEEKRGLYVELKFQPPYLISRLVEIADIFNSPHVVREALKKSGYSYGKGKISLTRFSPYLLKISEDRIRQMIFIAMFLEEQTIFQVLTHTLVIIGSRFWINGVGTPSVESPRWRRQYVLNTITDLQAYFLRAYGAMEEGPEDFKPPPVAAVPIPLIRQQPRQFQCRWAFGNSSACDAFHLGQIIRFFSLRTKTIFLGSTLIDPDFTPDPDLETDSDPGDGDGQQESENKERDKGKDIYPNSVDVSGSVGPSTSDISSLIASLKQCPDYQIDSNHSGCGVRRRLLPALDCIERFVGDPRGLLGIIIRPGSNPNVEISRSSDLSSLLPPTNSWWAWTNKSLRRADSVDIRFSKIVSIHFDPSSSRVSQQRTSTAAESLRSSRSPEEDARLFFTARRRDWEA
ncbi:hypothetical protein MPDQ_005549 [Monascus purpureus]|uniref:BTB domain-containing protein n=1 Tax=Monascus purpureus TaxID=5098 RepID=A0A507R527_MONPU|nr:hypothetical protein MPDQ_005549 [Monascus purpureus]